MRQDQHVGSTVIVEVAHGQAAAHPRDRPGGAGLVGDIGQAAVDPSTKSCAGIR